MPVNGANNVAHGGSNSQSNSGLNMNAVRENLNKSQNIVMPSGVNNAYAPQQLLHSSSRPKKTSLSFLRKSNINAVSGA